MTASRAPKFRLDEILVRRGLCESRSQAKAVIMSGRVRLGTEVLDKPGKPYPDDIAVELEQPPRFVGRGGEKLARALEAFAIGCRDKTALDIGASTGGFTDCLLQAGAARVTCVDVGRAQLHPKLRADDRVTNLEKTNARHLAPGDLPESSYDLVVMDVSFIPLRLVLPPAWSFLSAGGTLVALVKPQFEASKQEVDKGSGIIRDEGIRRRVLRAVEEFALANLPGAVRIGVEESPISGADGNREFLLALRKDQVSLPGSPELAG